MGDWRMGGYPSLRISCFELPYLMLTEYADRRLAFQGGYRSRRPVIGFPWLLFRRWTRIADWQQQGQENVN